MNIKIDREKLFLEKLTTGINLFTGAGFSCLPDERGLSLPAANKLCEELCERFPIPTSVGCDLETVSALAPKQLLQDYLRSRYTVNSYNDMYKHIEKIKLNSVITTNIDNILQSVIDNSSRYYLKSILNYGATRKNDAEVPYIPLHGDVTNIDRPLFFGKFDLAIVDQSNSDLFMLMYGKLYEAPTLFWGYGFHDSGVLRVVSKTFERTPQDIWVQCMPEDSQRISLFRTMGCNIIESNTYDLLAWIKQELPEAAIDTKSSKQIRSNLNLKKYFIPSINQVEAIPSDEYYIQGNTHWHCILANHAFELNVVNDIYDAAINEKVIVLVGGAFSGKTTALMQLAQKINDDNKLFVENVTPEEAKYIASNVGTIMVYVFLKNCANDIDAFNILAKHPTIKIISTADDFAFESSKHLIDGFAYRKFEMGEIQLHEAQRFYDHIPTSLRQPRFSYKENADEKFAMIEMVSKNVKGVLTQSRIRAVLRRIMGTDKKAFYALILTSYLTAYGSLLSIDVLFSFFDFTNYEQTRQLLSKVNNLLRDIELDIERDVFDQDYFALRSRLFSYYIEEILQEEEFRQYYAEVIRKFILTVSPLKVYNYYVFKRKAFDSTMFYSVFKKEADDLYQFLYDYDHNPYTLQQWALYKSKKEDFVTAFSYIDKALKERPLNFSLKNSQAIILYEANRKMKTPLAKEKMMEAMEILRECFKSDKRKIYHAQKFAEFALHFKKELQDTKYVDQARQWIQEIYNSGDSRSPITKRYLRELS